MILILDTFLCKLAKFYSINEFVDAEELEPDMPSDHLDSVYAATQLLVLRDVCSVVEV